MQKKLYHYTECGLSNIYLSSGYALEIIDGEEYFSVTDFDELHYVIAMDLVNSKYLLSHESFKFLRIEMNLSQKILGEKIGVDQQTIARWEKKQTSIPKLADIVMRALYLELTTNKSNINNILQAISDSKESDLSKKIILEDNEHWEIAA